MNKYKHYFGDVVYVCTDPQQSKYAVNSILLLPNDCIKYGLSSFDDVSYYFDFEITSEPDELSKLLCQ